MLQLISNAVGEVNMRIFAILLLNYVVVSKSCMVSGGEVDMLNESEYVTIW